MSVLSKHNLTSGPKSLGMYRWGYDQVLRFMSTTIHEAVEKEKGMSRQIAFIHVGAEL